MSNIINFFNNYKKKFIYNCFQKKIAFDHHKDNKINIFYMHHDTKQSGSLISLVEIIKRISQNKKFRISACNIRTDSKINLSNLGIKSYNFRFIPKLNLTSHGQHTGRRIFIFFTELAFIPFLLIQLLYIKIYKKEKFEIIHANESVLVLSGLIAKCIFNSKLILHIRSRQNKNLISNIFYKKIFNYVDLFIAIDEFTKETLPKPYINKCIIIYNTQSISNNISKKSDSSKSPFFNIGYAGAFTEDKGVMNSLMSIRNLIINKNLNINFYLAGYNVRETRNILLKFLYKFFKVSFNQSDKYIEFIKKNNLEKNFVYLKRVKNMKIFYNNIHLNLFTSTLNAYNRSIFEAAHFNIPSLISLNCKNKYGLRNNKNIFIIKNQNIQEIEKMIERLNFNRELVSAVGKEAKNFFKNKHDINKNILKLEDIYLTITTL